MLSAYLLNAGSELWGKKWRNAILFALKTGPKRFSEIRKEIPECSVKMLSEALNDMERDGLLIRTQYTGSIPVKVTYELHEDVGPFVDVLNRYFAALVNFFYKNHERHNVPPHIVELLKKQKLTSK